ncbi:MAG: cytochrome C oxidase subunit IV family protein [Bacteroidetes bacterium]|nr:cytochrome C oxidase subunit IV family protein [Bacteroidota bacterium]
MDHASHGHHITPKSLLIKVFGSLILLTILTVAVSRVHLGALNVPVAIAIAVVKMMLVVTVFMAVKWDNKVNALVIGLSALFVSIFLIFTLFDTAYRGDLSNVDRVPISDQQRQQSAEMAPADAGAAASEMPASGH